MSDRFHVNCELGVGMVSLDGPEAHHLATVCRLRTGDEVCLFNGDGHEYPGRVIEVSKRAVSVEVTRVESPERELSFVLHVAAPLPKGDRAQFLVEKLTELGVGRYTILNTARSVVQPREAKVEKLHRHVIEASKQCGRNVLMSIDSPCDWTSFIRGEGLPMRRLVAHPGGGRIAGEVGDVVVAVGPEGGFTEEEVRQALDAGWCTVGLGSRILRIETAALALAALLGVGG